jgi:hypothetical protein
MVPVGLSAGSSHEVQLVALFYENVPDVHAIGTMLVLEHE